MVFGMNSLGACLMSKKRFRRTQEEISLELNIFEAKKFRRQIDKLLEEKQTDSLTYEEKRALAEKCRKKKSVIKKRSKQQTSTQILRKDKGLPFKVFQKIGPGKPELIKTFPAGSSYAETVFPFAEKLLRSCENANAVRVLQGRIVLMDGRCPYTLEFRKKLIRDGKLVIDKDANWGGDRDI